MSVKDEAIVQKFKDFDDTILKYAIAHRAEWFKDKLDEDDVRSRFKSVLTWDDSEQCYFFKVKVKCRGSKYPTTLTHMHDDGVAVTEEDLNNKGCGVVVDMTAFRMWWMVRDSKFGITLQAESMMILPASQQAPVFNTKRSFEVAMTPDAESNKEMKVELVDEDGETMSAM